MPSKKKLNKLKSVENENLEEFADRVDNVDYVIGPKKKFKMVPKKGVGERPANVVAPAPASFGTKRRLSDG